MSLGEFEQLLLLAIVHLDAQAYGVTIRQEIETRTDREVAIRRACTPHWNSPRTQGLRAIVDVQSQPPNAGDAPGAWYFRLTAAGGAALRRSHDRLARMWKGVQPDLRKARS